MTEEALQRVIDGTVEERKYLCSLSFGLFAIYYFPHYFRYSLAPFQKDFIKDFEDITECRIRELILIAFREAGKTSLAKIYLIWIVAYKKREYINVDSFSKDNAERILFDIAFELTSNSRLKADFGILFSKERSVSDVKQNKINNFITENRIRIEAHSTGESVRGRLHLNKRPDLLLLDDFENNNTKTSKAHTNQIRDHITEAWGGLAENGIIIYLANYLSEYGNVQFLIDRSKVDEKIRLRNIPIIMDEKPAWDSKYCMTDQEAEETGKKSIESMQKQFGSYVFSYEFMNKPIDDAMSEFKQDYIQHISEEDVRQKETNCCITIDSAISKKESADFTGVTINFVSADNKWYARCYRLKINSRELIDHLFYLYELYKPGFMGVEETTFTIAIQPFLEEEMRKRQKFFVITPIKHKGINKETRIRGLIPRWESRSIFLIGDNTELLNEMRTFPHSLHDDVLDSLSMQVHNASVPFRKIYPLGMGSKEEVNPAI